MHFLEKGHFVCNLKNGKCISFILQNLKYEWNTFAIFNIKVYFKSASSNFSACEKVFPKKSELNRTVHIIKYA